MNNSTPKRRFGLSRLELFLSLAVTFGLVYMVYLFGFAAPDQSAREPQYLDQKAAAALVVLTERQAELDATITALRKRVEELAGSGSCEEMARLQAELKSLSTSLSLIETRLGELSRLLPQNKKNGRIKAD